MSMSDNTYGKLKTAVIALESTIPHRETLNERVSQANVGWHIMHSLKTINQIYQVVEQSDPSSYRKTFNTTRLMITLMGRIPRGKAKAPKQVRPPEVIDQQMLTKELAMANKNLELFKTLHPKAHFAHPYLGMYKRDHALKFLTLHTRHHLKIVQDILK